MPMIKSGRMAVLLLLAVFVILSETSFSQEEPQSSSDCKHCLNAKRYPACCSYWVFDLGIGISTTSLGYNYGYSSGANVMLFSDFGYMINRNEKTSIGGTLFGAVGNDRARAGVRFRYRRWLNDNTALDFSPGILLWGDISVENYYAEAVNPAFIVTTQLSYNSRITGYAGMEVFRAETYTYPYFEGTPVISQKSTETAFFMGAGLGQEAGLVGIGVIGGLIAIIALSWNYQVNY